MADAIEGDVLDEEIPTGEAEAGETDQAEVEAPEAEDEDEVLVSFDGEEGAPPPGEGKDTDLVRHLREQVRERDRQLKALQVQQQPKPVEVGEKPTMASVEYDEEAYERELDAWKERKAQADRQQAEAQQSQTKQLEAWNQRVAEVTTQIADLKARDFPQALDEVKSHFSEPQQVVLMQAPINSAKVIYALGKSPAKAAELAKIQDPVRLAAELARLEGKLTVTTQRKAPPPEQIVRGSAPLSRGADKHLERLEADAAKTGDRTKVVAYKREQKAKARS